MMEQETELFIEQLRKGDRAACQRLVGDYGPTVFQMVRRIVMQQEDAEESLHGSAGLPTMNPSTSCAADNRTSSIWTSTTWGSTVSMIRPKKMQATVIPSRLSKKRWKCSLLMKWPPSRCSTTTI